MESFDDFAYDYFTNCFYFDDLKNDFNDQKKK